MQIKETKTIYESTFGSPGDKGFHSYSGFKVLIPIKREGTRNPVKYVSAFHCICSSPHLDRLPLPKRLRAGRFG